MLAIDILITFGSNLKVGVDINGKDKNLFTTETARILGKFSLCKEGAYIILSIW